MQRIRTIKPEFFKHGGLYDAERETGLPLRIAFAGIWTLCDRDGRFKWKPREMKLDVLPYDDCDFSRVLDALATRGHLVKYACGSDVYGCIPSWKEHQFVNGKEGKSTIPEPQENQILDASLTREPREDHALTTEDSRVGTGGVKEGKGREGKTNAPTADVRDLYLAYPRHEAPVPAYKAIEKALTIKTKDELLVAVKAFAAKVAREKTEARYIPLPATWFNAGRWEDETLKPKLVAARQDDLLKRQMDEWLGVAK